MGQAQAGEQARRRVRGRHNTGPTHIRWYNRGPSLKPPGAGCPPRAVIAGLDPAPRGRTGVALARLEEGAIRLLQALSTPTIWDALQHIARAGPWLMLVDAPLATPYRGFRPAERLLQRCTGARLLPGGLPGMRSLTLLGLSLQWLLQEAGVRVVETHPTTALRTCPPLARHLALQGLDRDARDAAVAAVTGALYCLGCAVGFADRASLLVVPVCPRTGDHQCPGSLEIRAPSASRVLGPS